MSQTPLLTRGLAPKKREKRTPVDEGTDWPKSSFFDLAAEDEFTIFVAHEFFDALPIHVFEVSSPGFAQGAGAGEANGRKIDTPSKTD